jgi:Tol biopolymer transport system component
VLDFGLAKGAGTAESSPDVSQSPTIAYAATGAGVILGTAAYMSPEQARGKIVDRRTDIWSFGCVLYECLTRRQLFAGETVSDMIAKILEREPDWSVLPQDTPEKVRDLLRRCLDKDAKRRLRDIGEARLELEGALATRTSSRNSPQVVVPAQVSKQSGLRSLWLVAAVVLTVPATMLVHWVLNQPPEVGVRRMSLNGTPGTVLVEDGAENAISPDGRMVAFCAADSAGNVQLYLRPLDALTPRLIPGTLNASNPFWSADSRTIGFFADAKLKKVSVPGNSVEVLCDAKNGRGGTWNRDDMIVFSADGAGPLVKISGSGGEVERATTLDSTRHETAHRYPSFLPDGKHFLYISLPGREGKLDVCVGSLDSPKSTLLMTAATSPVYVKPGYLLYPRGSALVAQRFDPGSRKLYGRPIALPDLPSASQFTGYRPVSVSDDGDLCYTNGRVQNTELAWLDREGRRVGTVPMPAARYEYSVLSRDGRFAAVDRADNPAVADIWIVDLARSVSTRFTFGPGRADFPLWSPDGSRIAFQSNRNGPSDFFIKATNGATPESTRYASSVALKNLYAWTRYGISFEQLDATTGWDLYVLPDDGGPPRPYLKTPYNDRWGDISPDGHWMVYTSDESGQLEVYVQTYPTPGNKYRVSTAGGGFALWRADGREITYYAPDNQTVMACDIATTPSFHAGVPHPLFRMPPGAQISPPRADFQRWLEPLPVSDKTAATITVVEHWAAALAKR